MAPIATTSFDPILKGETRLLRQKIIAHKVSGTVKWFNVKSGYGFINRSDTKEDVFVHQTAIIKNNPKKAVRSVGDGEVVEFDVVIGEKGNEASNVSGPEGAPVKGSPYAADRRRGSYRSFRGRGGRGGGGNRSKGESGDDEKEDGDDEGKDGVKGRGRGRYRKFRPRYVRRGGKKSGDEDGPVTSGDEADREGDEGSRGRGRGRGRRGFRGRGGFRSRGRGGFRGRGGAGGESSA